MSKEENNEIKILKNPELISLLTIYYNNIASINDLFSTYMTVFLSGIFVVLGACVLGLISDLPIFTELVLVCAGALTSIALSIGLYNMTRKSIVNSLINAAKVVIVEEKLGLDNVDIYKSTEWKTTSLVFKLHSITREDTGTIERFIKKNRSLGQHKYVKEIISFIYWLSVSIILIEVGRFLYYTLNM